MSTAHDLDMAARQYDYFLGEVRAEIARRRLRQTSLAGRIGMPQQHLSARLSGHTPFRFVELIRLAEALDMTLTDLVGLADRNAISLRHGDDAQGWLHRHRAVAMAGWLPRRLRHTREAEIGAHLELLAPPVLGHAVASIPRPRGATDPIPMKMRPPA